MDTTEPRIKDACLSAIATSGKEYKVQKLTLLIKEMAMAVSARYGITFPEKEVSGAVILLLLAAQFMALEVAEAKVEKAEKATPAGAKENAAGREKIKAVVELKAISLKQLVNKLYSSSESATILLFNLVSAASLY